MSIRKIYLKLQLKLINLITFNNKNSEDVLKRCSLMFIVVIQFTYCHFIWENYFTDSNGIILCFYLAIIITGFISAVRFLKIMFKDEGLPILNFMNYKEFLNINNFADNISKLHIKYEKPYNLIVRVLLFVILLILIYLLLRWL
jgi:hypothetical protein